ncbi:MAG: hypothetical protein ACE5E6_08310 [Phycisphaerae bacterium]
MNRTILSSGWMGAVAAGVVGGAAASASAGHDVTYVTRACAPAVTYTTGVDVAYASPAYTYTRIVYTAPAVSYTSAYPTTYTYATDRHYTVAPVVYAPRYRYVVRRPVYHRRHVVYRRYRGGDHGHGFRVRWGHHGVGLSLGWWRGHDHRHHGLRLRLGGHHGHHRFGLRSRFRGHRHGHGSRGFSLHIGR